MAKNLSVKTASKAVKKPIFSTNNVSNAFPDRQKMIAEAAYFIAEKRNFFDGDPNEDWLSAEVEINCILENTKRNTKKNSRKKKT
jgi:hypothetical protein